MMVEALELRAEDIVLDVGTGSGYQAAVLSRLAKTRHHRRAHRVVVASRGGRFSKRPDASTSRRISPATSLAGPTARRTTPSSWAPAHRMFLAAWSSNWRRRDASCCPSESMRAQELVRVTKTSHGVELERLGPCAFVPLIAREAWPATAPR